MLLGYILGGILEQSLSRSLVMSDGSLSFIWERPLTLTIMIIAAILFVMPVITKLLEKRKTVKAENETA